MEETVLIDFKKDPIAWLMQEPLEHELSYNPNGSVYQDIEIIKGKLDILCNSNWQTQNFSHNFMIAPWGGFYCSGNTELIIDISWPPLEIKWKQPTKSDEEIKELINSFKNQPTQIWPVELNYNKRIIVGAATFDTSKYYSEDGIEKNDHFAATCLSLCIVNAAQNISPYFGKNLNKRVQEEKSFADKRVDAIKETLRRK